MKTVYQLVSKHGIHGDAIRATCSSEELAQRISQDLKANEWGINPITVFETYEDYTEDRDAAIARTAINKLTPEERRVLSIPKYL